MIIKLLADLIYGLLNILLVFDLPSLPDSVVTIADQAVTYILEGVKIIGAFTGNYGLGVLAVLLNLILLMHTAYMTFTFVKFILKKLPMLDIDM